MRNSPASGWAFWRWYTSTMIGNQTLRGDFGPGLWPRSPAKCSASKRPIQRSTVGRATCKKRLMAVPLKSPCACRLERQPPLTQVIKLRLGLSQVSLSRLNHWLPRGQTDSEVMQGTAEVHHEIADTVLPQSDPVFDDAAALDAAVDMLDPQPTVVQGLVGQFLRQRQLLAAWCLSRYEDLDLREREGQEAQILPPPAPCGQGRGRGLGHPLVMDAASGKCRSARGS